MKQLFVIICMLALFVACSQGAQERALPEAITSPTAQVDIQPASATASAPINQQTPQPATQSAPTQQSVSAPEPVIKTPKTHQVSISGFKFLPASLTVNAGDTVMWTNDDSAPHTVESSDGVLRSDELSKGSTYTKVMDKTGTYSYICGIHPSMRGSVTVNA